MADEFEKATPRPWAMEHSLTPVFAGPGMRAGLYCSAGDVNVEAANARLIVRAVNAFEPMRAALRAIEWSGGASVDRCPFCNRTRADGHREECKVAAALRAADGEA